MFAGLAAVVALYALWSVERVDVDCDLQLAAPLEVRPGKAFALRALVFCGLGAIEGPQLVTPAVELRALDPEGRELLGAGAGRLTPTTLQTLDGERVGSLPSEQVLVASATHGGTPLRVRRALHVSDRALPEPVIPREAGPLQQFALGRTRALGGAVPPDRMLPRVVGGACVPELPCTLLLWVGSPAAAVALRTGSAVSLEHGPIARETEGLLRFVVTVHGPEAELTFEARRAHAVVAERALRLPIALGEAVLAGGPSLLHASPGSAGGPSSAPALYTLTPPPGRDAVTLDVFVDGHWSHLRVWSRSPRTGELGPAPRLGVREILPDLPLSGLVRLQARSDRFSSDGAGARLLYVHQGGGASEALSALARALEQEPLRSGFSVLDEPGQPRASELWARELPAFALEDVEASAAFLLAGGEAMRARVPAPVSGRPAQLARLERTKVRMRYGVAGALALSAWLIALSVARRGLLAVDQAQAILEQARSEGEHDHADEDGHRAARERINARAKVLLMGLAVAAAFLAAALLIAAKSLWF